MAVVPVRNAEGILFGHSVQATDNFFIGRWQYRGLIFLYFFRSRMADNFSSWQNGQRRADGGGDYVNDTGLHLMRC